MAIDAEIRNIKAIAGRQDHPSPDSIKTIQDLESGSLKKEVAHANSLLFQDQRNNNPLPEIFNNPEYQNRFVAEFMSIWDHKIEEIEKMPPMPWITTIAISTGTASRTTFPSSSI